jgi:hypothetical protein
MAKRVTKTVAMELIQYVKKIEVKAHYWDPAAKSAFEFARQMDSPKLRKKNPAYDCQFIPQGPEFAPATVEVEYVNGSKWFTHTDTLQLPELRAELYGRAEEVEDAIERAGGGKDDAPAGKEAAKKGKK